MTSQAVMSDKEQSWVKEQLAAANKFIGSKGMVVKSVNDKESRFLAPIMSIWKMNLLDDSSVWVVTGDIPSDYAATMVATSARDAARHFSFKWQMQAENLMASNDSSQQEFAKYLISRAEGLYDMFDKDELWQ